MCLCPSMDFTCQSHAALYTEASKQPLRTQKSKNGFFSIPKYLKRFHRASSKTHKDISGERRTNQAASANLKLLMSNS